MTFLETKYKKEKQQMLAFAFLADLESSKKITSQKRAESEAGGRIKAFLKSEGCKQGLGNWELTHNPIIYVKPSILGAPSLNTTIILNNPDKSEFIIGVAGTNFISKYDWFVEDLEVTEQVAWNDDIVNYNPDTYKSVKSTKKKGVVSKSTAIALSNTWNKPNAEGKTVTDLLKESLPSSGKVIISVTGHSLGGAISPALAQALHDNESAWKPDDLRAHICTFIFAGPTPGDNNWVKYVTKSLARVNSIYNTKDIVPHAWEQDMIPKMRKLFSPNLPDTESKYGAIPNTLIDWIEWKSKKAPAPYKRWSGYTQIIYKEEKTFKGILPSASKYSAVTTEAKLLQKVIEADWKAFMHLDALDAACKVCKISTTLSRKKKIAALSPYLLYFCKFIVILGKEHIQQYQNWIGNPFLVCSMKYYTKMGAGLYALKGVGVIYKLFIDLAAHKKHN